jgi:hypothetical protein
MVWTGDMNGNFTGISPRYYELTGVPDGARIRDAIHPDGLRKTLQKLGEAIAIVDLTAQSERRMGRD